MNNNTVSLLRTIVWQPLVIVLALVASCGKETLELQSNGILNGEAAPEATLGIIGDFYFNTATLDLYGPKTEQGWGEPVNLKGDQGDQGATGPKGDKGDQGATGPKGTDGSTLLSGTGTPAGSVGKTGDYYLDRSSARLYGPKSNSGWGSPLNLRGPKGDKGDKGDPGTANVIYSDWIPLKWQSDWVYFAPMAVPAITQAVLDNGVVICYLKDSPASTAIKQLPHTTSLLGWSKTYTPELQIGQIKVTIWITSADGFGQAPQPTYNEVFRYVIIPGGVHASLNTQKQVRINDRLYSEHQLQAMKYEELTELLAL